MNEPPEYMRIEELSGLVNTLRVSLGLRRIQAISTLYNQLRRKEVPSRIELETGRKLYHRDSAIKALTQMKNRDLPWNRPGTAEELASREYMPLAQFCEAFRCTQYQFTTAIHALSLKAWRHPQTNRLWVHIEQAQQIAFYRSKTFLYRVLRRAEADFIIETRPYKTIYIPTWNAVQRFYFAPELSHMGSKHTEYKQK